eukprot:9996411-Alexandrium_andersonii.AAC.1
MRACGRAGGQAAAASGQAGGQTVMCACVRDMCVYDSMCVCTARMCPCVPSSSASWAFSPRAPCSPAALHGDLAVAVHARSGRPL